MIYSAFICVHRRLIIVFLHPYVFLPGNKAAASCAIFRRRSSSDPSPRSVSPHPGCAPRLLNRVRHLLFHPTFFAQKTCVRGQIRRRSGARFFHHLGEPLQLVRRRNSRRARFVEAVERVLPDSNLTL
jgi:hypothetical protein